MQKPDLRYYYNPNVTSTEIDELNKIVNFVKT